MLKYYLIVYIKIKKENVKIKSYKNVEGDNLTSSQYKHQKNLYESLLLFDYNKNIKNY